MSLLQKSVGFTARRVSRRGFLSRAAMVGTALAVAPERFLFEPRTAYGVASRSMCTTCSSLSPGNCDCGDLCCSGWTEFCCATHPETGNTCPPGTVPGGWWRADGAGLCDVQGVRQPRYYIDCNATCEPGCTKVNDSDGTCGAACHDFDCGCTNDRCDHRKTACTRFRYGQCNDDIPYVGAVVCRYVTCSPPWIWDPDCAAGPVLFSPDTTFHDRPCLHEREPIHARFAGQRGNQIRLRKGTRLKSKVRKFRFGDVGDLVVFGSWDGRRRRTVGVVKAAASGGTPGQPMTWYLRNTNDAGGANLILQFGIHGETPVVGDFNGDGIDEIGTFRAGVWKLRRSLGPNPIYDTINFGRQGDVPVVGDWNGDGTATLGVVRGDTWLLRNPHGPGSEDVQFEFAIPGGKPVVGDWDGDGIDGPGLVVGGQWHIRRDWWLDETAVFNFGRATDLVAVWGRKVPRK